MPDLKFFIALNIVSALGSVWAQEGTPPPFQPSAGIEIPSASITPKSAPRISEQPPQETAPTPPPPPPAIGRVFVVTGEWINAAGQPLSIASGVTAGEKITPKGAGKNTIGIALVSGSAFHRACPGASDCGNLVIPSPKSPISDNFERILNGLEKAPKGLKLTALGGKEAPVPTVLMTEAKQIHFGPVVMDLPKGYYDLQWIMLKDGALESDPSKKVQFPWSPSEPPADTISNPMQNGMYRFTILRNNAQASPPVDLLVLGHREYTRLRPYFEEARQISNSWNIPDPDIRAFQVLALYGINANRRE